MSYVPDRRLTNAEGQDTFPIRLSGKRMAWLTLPCVFDEADFEHITKWLRLIAEGGKNNVRNPGPPEPNGRLP